VLLRRFSETTDGDSAGKSGDARTLLGVMRTGLFASGLLLAGESIVELVLLMADKPTTATLHSIVKSLSDELPVRHCLCLCSITETYTVYCYFAAGRGVKYCSKYLSLFVCSHNSKTTHANFTKFLLHVACGNGSVLL